uniref:Uncharacterized protein n=1 Tax=Nelumbo nucifera TaxID=4432 RepID=A0A822ZGN7_NELNU|nr:TPA_asm: hypothetical protein HUJ06_002003 [Nelumbo nucifera]
MLLRFDSNPLDVPLVEPFDDGIIMEGIRIPYFLRSILMHILQSYTVSRSSALRESLSHGFYYLYSTLQSMEEFPHQVLSEEVAQQCRVSESFLYQPRSIETAKEASLNRSKATRDLPTEFEGGDSNRKGVGFSPFCSGTCIQEVVGLKEGEDVISTTPFQAAKEYGFSI